ncbi:copper resistance protein CopC [Streptomyces sp. NPDC051896]|uniref:copper resistance CopC/CopD family protein n=1 Tax=Streptomyces sp. NPDC051896 TaxID=3155416 RepID=UPI00341CA8C9
MLLFGGVGTASAHAVLTGSAPADGSVVKSAPKQVTLAFTESVGLLDNSFSILDPDNPEVRTGEPGHAAGHSDTAQVALPAKLAQGTYTVSWRVISTDSHPVSGVMTFSVGKPSSTTAVVAAPVTDPLTTVLYNLARGFTYAGPAMTVDLAAFGGRSAALRRPLAAGWWGLVVSTLALLLLRGPYEHGSGPEVSSLPETITSQTGVALLSRLVLLAAAAVCIRLPVRGRARTVGGAMLAVALALTWAATGHAAASIQAPVAVVSTVLHVLAMSVWLGGLAALLSFSTGHPRTSRRPEQPASPGSL